MSEPREQLRKEHLTFRGAPIFLDWMIIMRNVSPAGMGVLRDVLGCPGVTSVLTGHRVCGMLRRGIGRQPWNDVFGRRTRKPLLPLPASPRGPVTSRVVRFSRPVTHLRLTAVRVGTLGRGRSRRSIQEMRHGWSVDAPRHGAVMALTRIGLSLFALHPRPLVMRYGWSGLTPRHQCAMKGWSLLLQFHVVRRGPQGLTLSLTKDERGLSDDDFIGYDEFPEGFSGSSPEHSCDDDELLASPPCPPLTPLPVDSPKDNPGRVGIFAIGKRRVPQGPYPPVMVSPVGLGRAIRVLLRPLVMRTVVGCDVPGVRRCPPLIRKVLSGWTRIMPRIWILCYGIPVRLWTRMECTSRWWVRTYRPSRCWFPRFLSWTNLLLRPVRQDSRHQILNLPWGNLWIWWSLPSPSPWQPNGLQWLQFQVLRDSLPCPRRRICHLQ